MIAAALALWALSATAGAIAFFSGSALFAGGGFIGNGIAGIALMALGIILIFPPALFILILAYLAAED